MEYVQHKSVFLPNDVRIAGVRIGRVTLGHLRLLELAESPFLAGGEATTEDCAVALSLLSRPWRRGLWLLRSVRRLALRVAWMARFGGCGRDTAATAGALRELVDRVLWHPERFEEEGREAPSPFDLATGVSVRLAMRAAGLPLERLCHAKKGAWDCVWDAPVDAVMMYAVAQEEARGAQFANPAEAEMAEDFENGK